MCSQDGRMLVYSFDQQNCSDACGQFREKKTAPLQRVACSCLGVRVSPPGSHCVRSIPSESLCQPRSYRVSLIQKEKQSSLHDWLCMLIKRLSLCRELKRVIQTVRLYLWLWQEDCPFPGPAYKNLTYEKWPRLPKSISSHIKSNSAKPSDLKFESLFQMKTQYREQDLPGKASFACCNLTTALDQ